ncbi:DUF4179 domain-containing protein [Bacillus circulans]|uniref:DUF4179 domain-containing protein n=1 Tax=Niallia circulans TaxID=1397 RepID=UPI00148F6310|nr:DUF4179 domain-containing protein [Niallia circulans]NRG28589.1 DUF4179 domain-containing protein [Niallia circulans]QJX61648.1 DUF4179 domain-containing protein [Niallia circulans]
MYEEEEQRLSRLKADLEKTTLPLEKAEEAILSGILKAKQEKNRAKKKQKRLIGLAIASIIIISFVTSIRISPTFANALSSIPGMEWLIGYIEQDKGYSAIIENDYYQKVDVSETKGDLTLTIDGVIMDESGINIFYTLQSTKSLTGGKIKDVNLFNKEEFPEHAQSNNVFFPDDIENEFQSMVEYQFVKPFSFKDLKFNFEFITVIDNKEIKFLIPFELKENIKKQITYPINQVVEVENQKMTIEEMIVYPLRIGVKVAFDPANTKEILGFEDMRLENENGEVWSAIANGIVNTTLSKYEKMYYLQSNYFEKPKDLYLRINKLMAIDKEEAMVIVNTETNTLINSPKDDRLKLGKTSKSQVEFSMDSNSEEDPKDLFSTAIAADGKELSISKIESRSSHKEISWILSFDNTMYKNPLKLELAAYPNYIKGDIKVKLK